VNNLLYASLFFRHCFKVFSSLYQISHYPEIIVLFSWFLHGRMKHLLDDCDAEAEKEEGMRIYLKLVLIMGLKQ